VQGVNDDDAEDDGIPGAAPEVEGDDGADDGGVRGFAILYQAAYASDPFAGMFMM
jgi:hypothetical protein